MATNFGTLTGILQEKYLGKIRSSINNSTRLLTFMKKEGVTWNGLEGVIAIHVGHSSNGGVSGVGKIPTPSTAETVVQAKFSAAKYYHSFKLEGELITASAGSNAASYVPALTLTMKGLAEQVGIDLNKYAFSGGRVVGFLNEVKVAGGAADWQFSGDFAKLNALLAIKAGPINVQPIRMDTYAAIGAPIALSAVSIPASTVHLNVALTTAQAAGYAVALKVVDTDAALLFLDEEPVGIYGNLAEPTHLGQDRTTATGFVNLQATIKAANQTGTQAFAAFALDQFETQLADMETVCGMAPTRIWVPISFRPKYAKLFQANLRVTLDQGKGPDEFNGGVPQDANGEEALSYGKLKIECDRHCGKNLAIFMKDDTWMYAIREVGDFDKTTGNILRQVIDPVTSQYLDSFMGYWKQYYNVVCDTPFCNGILCGVGAV